MTANSNTYAYNANGNLTTKTDATGSWTYTWDYENRLMQASKASGATVTYNYDALGRRVQGSSTVTGTTKFVYDGADVLRDLNGIGNTIVDYLNGPGIDNKLRQISGGAALYFIQDHLGTTRALADASGNVASSLDYDSYGNISSGSASTRYTYTGREIDSDVGLIYYRARWYDPEQGRFISEDPIGLEAGLNVYGYVNSNPVNFADPLGLYPPNQRRGAAAWLALTEGKQDDALRLMRSAAELEASTEKHPVTPGAIIPAAELLGDMLIELNQPEQALLQFEISLKGSPNRFNGLYGAARAAQLAGNRKKAGSYYAQLVTLSTHADSVRTELQKAKDFLAQK